MRRVWISSGILVGAAVAAVALIVTIFPSPRTDNMASGADSPVAIAPVAPQDDAAAGDAREGELPVGAMEPPAEAIEEPAGDVPAPAPVSPASPAAIAAARDAAGVGGDITEPGGTLPTPIEPSADLRAALTTYVDDLQDELPRLDGDVSLEKVSRVGNQLHFANTVQIDLAEYGYAYDPELLGPHLLGWACDGSMCFEFTEDYAREPCRSDLADLIARGAVAVYVYRDTRGRFMGQMAVTDDECGRLADQ